MGIMEDMLSKVEEYLKITDFSDVPVMQGKCFRVMPLAQGEYNLNYVIETRDTKLVFRVNMGTQIDRDDQIMYEYKALKLLASSGVTPKPYYVDDSRKFFDRGILIEEFIEGENFIYQTDLLSAVDVFARIHQIEVAEDDNHLIRENAALSLIFDECKGLLQKYFDSDLADPSIRTYLMEVKEWADEARINEKYYSQDPWPCIVNTEVNSGNFIVNRDRAITHLVDWEMPRWGDPSQDLAMFCSPLTTMWKTTYRMSHDDHTKFISSYKNMINDKHLIDTLDERIRLRQPFVYLRGISWSAMGWVAYQTDYDGIPNPDTWEKLNQYMDLELIRSLFDEYIKG